MRRIALGAAAFLVAVVTSLGAQQTPKPQQPKRPDFSGVWIQVTPADGAGDEQTIKQTDKTLTMSHASEGGGHQLVLNLDGSESHSTIQSHGTDIATVSKVTWNGDRMTVTSRTTYEPGRGLDQTMVWWIDDKGQLVIDLTESMTGRPVQTIQIVHRKK